MTKETKAQGFGKTLFSGESLFIYHINGNGLLWLTSFGAVDKLDVSLLSAFGENEHVSRNWLRTSATCLKLHGGSALSFVEILMIVTDYSTASTR